MTQLMAISIFTLYQFLATIFIMKLDAHCPKASGTGVWRNGQKWFEAEQMMQCNGTTAVIVKCIKEANKEFIEIGKQYDDGPLRKQCTDHGPLVTACLDAGIVVKHRRFLDAKTSVLKDCVEGNVSAVACKISEEQKPVGDWFIIDGVRKLCTETGLASARCRAPDGTMVDQAGTFVDPNWVKWNCDGDSLQLNPVSCSKNGQDVTLGSSYHDKGTHMLRNCTDQGLRSFSCLWNGERYAFGQNVIDDTPTRNNRNNQLESTVSRQCTENGVIVLSCAYYHDGGTRKNLEDGTTATDHNGVKLKCQGHQGIVALFCESSTLGTADFGQSLLDSYRRGWQCQREGLRPIGCVDKSGKSRDFNVTWREQDGNHSKMQCTQANGLVPIAGCFEGIRDYKIGDQTRDSGNEGLIRVCKEHGFETLKCFKGDKEFNIGELFANDVSMLKCTEQGIVVQNNWKRTVIFVEYQSKFGENMFLRGGISHVRNKNCTKEKPLAENPCAIPIRHITKVKDTTESYRVWAIHDHYLDWYGADTDQGSYSGRPAAGTPLMWTTNDRNNINYQPLNTRGPGMWMVELLMDCSRTQDGWFEHKAWLNNWERDLQHQTACDGSAGGRVPFNNGIDHVGRCGYINTYRFQDPKCSIDRFP